MRAFASALALTTILLGGIASAANSADQTVASIRYASMGINGSATLGGRFQGSVDGTVWVDLYIIGTATDYDWHDDLTPASPPGADLATAGIPGCFRYLRYSGRDNSGCNIGELRFYNQAKTLLDGVHIGTPGSYLGLGNDLSKVFDGDPMTYFDAPTASGGWVGVDLGAAAADLPTVALTSPAGSGTVTGSATLSASAAAGAGHSLATVEFFTVTPVTAASGGASLWSKVGEANTAPYRTTLSASAGTYTVFALATDTDGNSTLSAPGTISLTSDYLTEVAFYAAPWSNLAGCRFQGNNLDGSDAAPWEDLYTIPASALTAGGDGLYHAAINATRNYHYLRFRQLAPANGQIATIKFLFGATVATGTVFSDGATGAEAFDGNDFGSYFNDGQFTGLDLGQQADAAPAAVTALAAVPGDTSVSLNWSIPAGVVAGCNIYRGTSAGNQAATPINGGAPVLVANYLDGGLVNGTTYFYIVRAVNDVGEGVASNEASATPDRSTATVTRLVVHDAGGGCGAGLASLLIGGCGLAVRRRRRCGITSGRG